MNLTLRRTGIACTFCLLLLSTGCHRKRKTRSAPKSESYADKLKPIVKSKHLQVLHHPDFADYETPVQTFYDDRNFEVAWVDEKSGTLQPSPQAAAFIQAFTDAQKKGLSPEDYNASRWPDLTHKLTGKNDDDVAAFDAAMTVSVMRYISDLRIGRVNPTHFNFDIDNHDKKYNLPEFLSDNAVDADDVPKLIASVEPDSDQYRKTEDALAHYLKLATQQSSLDLLKLPLPAITKTVLPGQPLEFAGALQLRLSLEDDLTGPMHADAGVAFNPPAPIYAPPLVDAVKHFQTRHGLTPDGKLTPQTIAALNVPLSARVQQLSDSLERWRWLPNQYVNAPLMVNLPEFVLRGYSGQGPTHTRDFTMKVVDGKAMGEHDTPVFTRQMKYLIFRPFWNVPNSIIKKELTGHIEKSGVGYLASHNFETVDNTGHVVNASAAQVEHFNVNVREKPGPKNSLGLIKFMFPNEYDIYLHSTPQPELFERTRRDFSHGCIRVQHPDDLAVWVLNRSQTPGDWPLDKVQEAMQSGQDNHQVNLKTPLPIAIFYLTANVADDGTVHFFDDIYGYDQQLDEVLAKGAPYPTQQQKINPKLQPGETL